MLIIELASYGPLFGFRVRGVGFKAAAPLSCPGLDLECLGCELGVIDSVAGTKACSGILKLFRVWGF